MTSNVILFGHASLTDAERVTYQAIDSFDWSDGAGLRKGYAYPPLRTLATLRGIAERTIRRHLAGLEAASLLTRELRPARTSILWIEEPSPEESEGYLARLRPDPDICVRGTPDTDVRPNKKDEERNRQNPVNAVEHESAVSSAIHIDQQAHEKGRRPDRTIAVRSRGRVRRRSLARPRLAHRNLGHAPSVSH